MSAETKPQEQPINQDKNIEPFQLEVNLFNEILTSHRSVDIQEKDFPILIEEQPEVFYESLLVGLNADIQYYNSLIPQVGQNTEAIGRILGIITRIEEKSADIINHDLKEEEIVEINLVKDAVTQEDLENLSEAISLGQEGWINKETFPFLEDVNPSLMTRLKIEAVENAIEGWKEIESTIDPSLGYDMAEDDELNLENSIARDTILRLEGKKLSLLRNLAEEQGLV